MWRLAAYKTLIVAISAWLVLLTSCAGDGGTTVVLTNKSSNTLHSVVVCVTGNSYHTGDLEPNKPKSLKVYPNGESHLEIELVGPDGSKETLCGLLH